MILDLTLLFFVLLGSKIVLGVIAVYMLVPRERRCAICDAEMIALQHARGTVILLRILRLQRRWCMECERESLTRSDRLHAAVGRATIPVAEPRVR